MKASRITLVLVAVAAVGIAARFAHKRMADPPVHSVTLHWTPTAGAASYNVYRGTISGGPYTRIGHTLAATYLDSPVPGGAVFYYVVTAIRDHAESGYSKEIKAAIP